ncbi:hypothetical protein [Asaia prunellae]|uniref:hypothetical protein n=1 Tax=Asaia prunellae TaxID=610245 RepID=UPI0011DE1EF5|nr:hypothetical protein [Asaia prunellae]
MKKAFVLISILVCNNAFANDLSKAENIPDCGKAGISGTQISSLKDGISSALLHSISEDEWKNSNILISRVNMNIQENTIIAYLDGTNYCGSGGCTTLILSYGKENNKLRLVSRLTVVKLPIILLQSSSHGWRDMAVHVSARDEKSSFAVLRFDGQKYPGNPSIVSEKTSLPNGNDIFGKDSSAGLNCVLH